ncbi:hypothetical protein ABZP36_024691 [Zizania latifolia]
MITGSEVYQVVEAMVPLYTAAALGYGSVRWLKAFSNEQCAGINHFVALYAVPVLIFDMVSTNDIYNMNGLLIAADTLQKAVLLLGLMAWALWARSRRRAGGKAAVSNPLQWVVTCFSVASLPNTIIMGVPLLNGMYGPMSKNLMKQIVVMQFCIWYNVVIFLYEYMDARRAAAALALDGSAKISPSSPVKQPQMEKAAAKANGCSNVDAAERPQEVAVNIEITDMAAAAAAASTAPDGSSADTPAAAASDGASDATEAEEVSAPAPSVKHVIWMAVKKLLQIPNTYASFLGLIWALFAFKYGFSMPKIISDSLFTIRTTAVGLSMFASGYYCMHLCLHLDRARLAGQQLVTITSSPANVKLYVSLVQFRDVHSAPDAIRPVRLQDRHILHDPQVSDRPGADAVHVAHHRHARHTSAHRCCPGELNLTSRLFFPQGNERKKRIYASSKDACDVVLSFFPSRHFSCR